MESQNEQRMAQTIMKTVRRLQLPFKLDEITEGKGDCFPLAIIAQCRRPEVFQELDEPIRIIVSQRNPNAFRKEVQQFMTKSINQHILKFRETYEEVLATLEKKTWSEYWGVMTRQYEWVDFIFIQGTAWYLNHDIIIITTSNTEDKPYITISGNLADENLPCKGVPLTIGSLTNSHYQSLLPAIKMYTKDQIKRTKAANPIILTLTEKQKTVQTIKEIPNLNCRTEFPDLASMNKNYRKEQHVRNKITKSKPDNITKEEKSNESHQQEVILNVNQEWSKHSEFQYKSEKSILNFKFKSNRFFVRKT